MSLPSPAVPSPGFTWRGSQDAERDEVPVPSGVRVVHRYFGTATSPRGTPQGVLIDYEPHVQVDAHFHPIDQFQIFLGADGARYGRQPMGEVLLHYTDAYTPYGPFSTGDLPARLFTLRPQGSDFVAYMPRDRSRLRGRPGRHHRVQLDQHLGRALDVGASDVRSLITSDADGLAALLIRGGPNTSTVNPLVDADGVQFTCVLSGSVVHDDGRTYGALSLGCSVGSSKARTFRASDRDGFSVLVLQFAARRAGPSGPRAR